MIFCIDHYCVGVSNKHCLLPFSSLFDIDFPKIIYRFKDIQYPNKPGTLYDYQPCSAMSGTCGDGSIGSVAVCTA